MACFKIIGEKKIIKTKWACDIIAKDIFPFTAQNMSILTKYYLIPI